MLFIPRGSFRAERGLGAWVMISDKTEYSQVLDSVSKILRHEEATLGP